MHCLKDPHIAILLLGILELQELGMLSLVYNLFPGVVIPASFDVPILEAFPANRYTNSLHKALLETSILDDVHYARGA